MNDTNQNIQRRPKRRRNQMKQLVYRYFILLSVISVIAIVSLIVAISLQVKLNRQKRQAIEAGSSNPSYSLNVTNSMVNAANAKGRQDLLDDITNKFSQGTSTTSYLRNLFPEKIVFYDKDHYVFSDINRSLPLHGLNLSAFSTDENGIMTYADPAIQTHKGIDVSRYQGNIDWAKVKDEGVEYVMIRSGYRSYGTGVLKEDELFSQNAAGALQCGLHVGVYFFSQAINTAEAEEEAQFVADQLKAFKIDYPVVIDIEEIANDTYRQQDLTASELTDVVVAFCEKIKSFGYTPMIYANIKGFTSRLEIERLSSFEKWYAEYSNSPYFPYEMGIWQYSESGRINGIDANVDLNISFKTW